MSRGLDEKNQYHPKMLKKSTFAERLEFALNMHGVPMEAPKVHVFVARRAKELGIPNPAKSRQTIHNWLKGKSPDPVGYARLSVILNVSTYWLIMGEYPPLVPATPSRAPQRVPSPINQGSTGLSTW